MTVAEEASLVKMEWVQANLGGLAVARSVGRAGFAKPAYQQMSSYMHNRESVRQSRGKQDVRSRSSSFARSQGLFQFCESTHMSCWPTSSISEVLPLGPRAYLNRAAGQEGLAVNHSAEVRTDQHKQATQQSLTLLPDQ
jgi:hypothetical protein